MSEQPGGFDLSDGPGPSVPLREASGDAPPRARGTGGPLSQKEQKRCCFMRRNDIILTTTSRRPGPQGDGPRGKGRGRGGTKRGRARQARGLAARGRGRDGRARPAAAFFFPLRRGPKEGPLCYPIL